MNKDNENFEFDTEEKEIVFEEPEYIDSEKLIEDFNDFDFDDLKKHKSKIRATKPKNLTKKQKKTRSKIAKLSRKRNRQ